MVGVCDLLKSASRVQISIICIIAAGCAPQYKQVQIDYDYTEYNSELLSEAGLKQGDRIKVVLVGGEEIMGRLGEIKPDIFSVEHEEKRSDEEFHYKTEEATKYIAYYDVAKIYKLNRTNEYVTYLFTTIVVGVLVLFGYSLGQLGGLN